MQPDSYDLYDQWFHNVDFVWPARAIQPIDTRRIALWHEINDLPKRGRLSPNDRLGSGSVPSERLFVQHDGSLGSTVTERISMLPLTHNADSFAYRPERLPDGFSHGNESWGWLLDPLGPLAWADRIVCTPDSVNMLSEACATRAPVFVFAPGPLDGAPQRFVDGLLTDGRARVFEDALPAFDVTPLRETARIADEVRARLGP